VGELYEQLRDKGLPSWSSRVDRRHGGYVLSPDEKQLATQSRMVWTFAHAHRRGVGDYLGDAGRGFDFLVERFRDRRNGGFFWATDAAGRPVDERKLLYGHAFAIHAFVEYARAGGGGDAVREAHDLFRLVHERAHDDRFGGWLQGFTPTWELLDGDRERLEFDAPGVKGANTHLHVLEALAELYDATRDSDVRAALEEACEVCTTRFFPPDPTAARQFRTPRWEPLGPREPSHGHSIEFAWLLVRAESLLEREVSRGLLSAYLAAALDHEDGDLVWWETAELLAALAVALRYEPEATYADALDRLLGFALEHQIDPADGVWRHTVARDGTPVNPTKFGTWKDAYHEARATLLLKGTLL
jgi:mannobiose 2-epimerase